MTRTYVMRARARGVDDRRARILDAAGEVFVAEGFDRFSLEAVAARVGVSVKTITRQFGGKDELLAAFVQHGPAREEQRRDIEVGDLDAVVRVLADRYEELAEATVRFIGLIDRLEVVDELAKAATASHREWLAAAFAPWLPARGPVRRLRLTALYGATEIYVWWMWRRRLGLGREAAAAAMRETLEALVSRWSEAPNPSHTKARAR